jgi:hypothetical protein
MKGLPSVKNMAIIFAIALVAVYAVNNFSWAAKATAKRA